MADEVMRMPEPEMQRQVDEEEEEEILQTKPLVDQITPLVQIPVEEEEREELLQVKSREDATSEVPNDLESQINAIHGGGRPLAESERAYFEPRFGADFSQVRLHTDSQAAESARAVNARAFTVGKDLFFGKGQYVPKTTTGKKLLAHELTHTIQHINKAGKKDETVFKAIEHMGTFVAKKQNTIRLMRQPTDAGVPSDAGVSVPNETGESNQYRDLQVACVIRLGGCSNRRPGGNPSQDEITSYNKSCRRESTYKGQDITPSDAECANPPRPESISSALHFARRLNDIYPGWLDTLPNCPCTDREARANPSMWEGPNACMDTYHPGAATGFRSTSGYSSVAGTSHGQQCCYDKEGALITKGAGAGTPDSVAPIGFWGVINHYFDDVRTFDTLGWQVYNQYWIPNKGQNCPVGGKEGASDGLVDYKNRQRPNEYRECLFTELERSGGLPSEAEVIEAVEKCSEKTGYPAPHVPEEGAHEYLERVKEGHGGQEDMPVQPK